MHALLARHRGHTSVSGVRFIRRRRFDPPMRHIQEESTGARAEILGKSERGTARSEGLDLSSDADIRDACVRLQRAVRGSESYVALRHTAVTFRHAATADNSRHGSDTVRERVRSHAAGPASGIVWECLVFRRRRQGQDRQSRHQWSIHDFGPPDRISNQTHGQLSRPTTDLCFLHTLRGSRYRAGHQAGAVGHARRDV